MPSILQATCLSPKRTLRTQLFSSFGIAAFLTLFVAVLTSCLAIHKAGEDVKGFSKGLMQEQVRRSLLRSSELLAEKVGSRTDSVDATVQILVEAVMDRIVGYPTFPNWDDGMYVPFEDYYYAHNTTTPDELDNNNNNDSHAGGRRYRYPLQESPAPLDWDVIPDGLDGPSSGTLEYTDGRIRDFKGLLSTRSGSYHMPGSCNPDLDGVKCSTQYNNVTTGGIHPTETHYGIYQATGDLSVFMKALYESDPELLKIQILFFNEGAGSTLQFPAGTIPPLMDTYTSHGCDWMVR